MQMPHFSKILGECDIKQYWREPCLLLCNTHHNSKPEIYTYNEYIRINLKIFVRYSDFCTMVF